jgi:hypothetical protein
MNKLNGNAKMKVSGENPATAHTLDRYGQFDQTKKINKE